MKHQQRNFFLYLYLIAILVIISGCAPQIQTRVTSCPGVKSVIHSKSLLRKHSDNVVPFRVANGHCRLAYYVEDKLHRENFGIKIWVEPPDYIYLQGDIALDGRALVLGSNNDEFWFWLKPQISSYWWGKWSQQTGLGRLIINPKILLEAFGIAEVSAYKGLTLTTEDEFDVLTVQDSDGRISKRIYISKCDYLIRKIEYIDDGKIVAFSKLEKYKPVTENLSIPSLIILTNLSSDGPRESTEITLSLKSVKPLKLTESQKKSIFERRLPKGFKHVYKVINADIIELTK